MNKKNLSSNRLPELDMTIKEFVNSGQWFLFDVSAELSREGIHYLLRVDDEIYGLDDNGNVLNFLTPGKLTKGTPCFFDDVKRPASLSNRCAETMM